MKRDRQPGRRASTAPLSRGSIGVLSDVYQACNIGSPRNNEVLPNPSTRVETGNKATARKGAHCTHLKDSFQKRRFYGNQIGVRGIEPRYLGAMLAIAPIRPGGTRELMLFHRPLFRGIYPRVHDTAIPWAAWKVYSKKRFTIVEDSVPGNRTPRMRTSPVTPIRLEGSRKLIHELRLNFRNPLHERSGSPRRRGTGIQLV